MKISGAIMKTRKLERSLYQSIKRKEEGKMRIKRSFHTIDTHTCGEPTRNVIGGIPTIPGNTMEEKLEYMSTKGDWIRQLLTYEPRGNDVMSGTINNPGSAGIAIERETFQEIFKLSYTAVVKESSGSMQKLTEVLIDAPEEISIFCGCDNLAFESFADGAVGWISMLANIAPKECVELFQAVAEEKNYEKGMEIYKHLLPALNVLESFPKPVQAIKYALCLQGRKGGFVRRPRMELTEEEKQYVKQEMKPQELK